MLSVMLSVGAPTYDILEICHILTQVYAYDLTILTSKCVNDAVKKFYDFFFDMQKLSFLIYLVDAVTLGMTTLGITTFDMTKHHYYKIETLSMTVIVLMKLSIRTTSKSTTM